MDDRLPAALEVASLMRRASTNGDFAAIVKKGDVERGSLLLLIRSRDRHVACLERALGVDGRYGWQVVGPAESAESAEVGAFVERRVRFDADLWAVELDVADPERFIAETTAAG